MLPHKALQAHHGREDDAITPGRRKASRACMAPQKLNDGIQIGPRLGEGAVLELVTLLITGNGVPDPRIWVELDATTFHLEDK